MNVRLRSGKDWVKTGATSDPAVIVFIKPLLRAGVFPEDQIFKVSIRLDSHLTLDQTILYLGEVGGRYVLQTSLKSAAKGDFHHYEVMLGPEYFQEGYVKIQFKHGKGHIAKMLALKVDSLPEPKP